MSKETNPTIGYCGIFAQIKNCGARETALKQRSFVGNDSETYNGTTSVARQQILNKKE
jgi:hypothetical protein